MIQSARLKLLSLEKTNEKNIKYIKIDYIRPNPYQPRRKFEMLKLEDLCKSIKQYGVLQPINVRKVSLTHYELISGERRLRAAKMAEFIEIPAIVLEANEEDSAIIALIENLQRENLGYMEEALGYRNLIQDHKLTQEELAMKIGKSQSTIANKIRLLKLPVLVKKMLADNNMTERHARALLRLHDEQAQLKILQKACEDKLTVKATEDLVEKTIRKFFGEQEKKQNMQKKIRDIRIFVNTIKEAITIMKKSGVNAKAAQIDRGEFVEFIVRIPKKSKA